MQFDAGSESGLERRGPRARENLSNYRCRCRNLLPSKRGSRRASPMDRYQKGKEPIEISLAWNAKVVPP
jgi:hypothetical protein